MADGLVAQGTSDRQLAARQRDATLQQRRLDLQTQLYKSGLDSYQNVQAAQMVLYTTQTTLVMARLNQRTSQVDLYRVLGAAGWSGTTRPPGTSTRRPSR